MNNLLQISKKNRITKLVLDVFFAIIGLSFTWWIILLAALFAALDTKSNGFFTQERIGKDGKLFKVIKIKTMRPSSEVQTTVTTKNDPRITPLGSFFRKTKIDELPQLINILLGQMSFVGPRPDVPGYADKLSGEDKIILSLRPGITGPATLKYRNEEALLAKQQNPEKYNQEIIYPDKVKINKDYIKNYSVFLDLRYIFQTFFS